MYNYMTKDGFPRSLRTYHPTEYRIFCESPLTSIGKLLEQLSEITPHAVMLSEDRNNEYKSILRSHAQPDKDLKMHHKLFKNADYILMAPGYTMLGTYRTGQEQIMVRDFKSLFNLL